MIQVTVKPHATLREVFGRNNLVISVPEDSKVDEVLVCAIDRFQEVVMTRFGLQGAQDFKQNCILLLNGVHYSKEDGLRIKVKEGDQIEIRMPLAGG
jgi:molybdopterin converting factor small subunit